MDEKREIILQIITKLDLLNLDVLNMIDILLKIYLNATQVAVKSHIDVSGSEVIQDIIVSDMGDRQVIGIVDTVTDVELEPEINHPESSLLNKIKIIKPKDKTPVAQKTPNTSIDDQILTLIKGIVGDELTESDARMIEDWENLYTKPQILHCLQESYRGNVSSLKHTNQILPLRFPSNVSTEGTLSLPTRVGKLRFGE